MKRLALLGIVAVLASLLAGCGSQDVTGATVDEAMKEREAKAKALEAKDANAVTDHSKEAEQDPQMGGKK